MLALTTDALDKTRGCSYNENTVFRQGTKGWFPKTENHPLSFGFLFANTKGTGGRKTALKGREEVSTMSDGFDWNGAGQDFASPPEGPGCGCLIVVIAVIVAIVLLCKYYPSVGEYFFGELPGFDKLFS